MNRQVYIYTEEEISEELPDTDYLRMHASLQPGYFRLNPAAIKRVCETYDSVILSLPLTTSDAFQQGNIEIQQAFILELFQHWAASYKAELILKKECTALLKKKAVHHVTSVQAWYDKSCSPAAGIAESYFRFLSKFTKRLIGVNISHPHIVLTFLKIPLLTLSKDLNEDLPETMSSWIISGGVLVRKSHESKGRLWFVRSRHKSGLTYAAITHYKPALPWILYLYSQALLHKFVMHKFSGWRDKSTPRLRYHD